MVLFPTNSVVQFGNVIIELESELEFINNVVLELLEFLSKSIVNFLFLFLDKLITPVPFDCKFKSIFLSSPVDCIVGPNPELLLFIVNSFTAEFIWLNFNNSLLLLSIILPPFNNLIIFVLTVVIETTPQFEIVIAEFELLDPIVP